MKGSEKIEIFVTSFTLSNVKQSSGRNQSLVFARNLDQVQKHLDGTVLLFKSHCSETKQEGNFCKL